jgi:L-fuculose-phosphate aldolase
MLNSNLTNKISEISLYLYNKGLCPGKSGNISTRAKDIIAITPSGVSLGKVKPKDVILVDLTEKILIGQGKPSSELPFHLEVYKSREDVMSIVHTHSPYATGFALAKERIGRLEGFGKIDNPFLEMLDYAPPGSTELARLVGEGLKNEDVVLLEGHGVVATGKTLDDAALLAEFVEETAKTQFVACVLRNRGHTLK